MVHLLTLSTIIADGVTIKIGNDVWSFGLNLILYLIIAAAQKFYVSIRQVTPDVAGLETYRSRSFAERIRYELLCGQLRLDRGDRVFSTNHARQAGGQP